MYAVLMMWHRMNTNSELSSGTSLLGIGIRLHIVEGSAYDRFLMDLRPSCPWNAQLSRVTLVKRKRDDKAGMQRRTVNPIQMASLKRMHTTTHVRPSLHLVAVHLHQLCCLKGHLSHHNHSHLRHLLRAPIFMKTTAISLPGIPWIGRAMVSWTRRIVQHGMKSMGWRINELALHL